MKKDRRRKSPGIAPPEVVERTQQYESWLGARLTLVPKDLEKKHADMAADAFTFLRATFYLWPGIYDAATGGALTKAPKVLSVGDLHVENFGTWRDVEGRLIWGVNDFDEAYPLPYTSDLVRLTASAELAISARSIKVTAAKACRAILAGYSAGLKQGGRPFVLAEANTELRDLAVARLKEPGKFWSKLDGQAPLAGPIPASAVEALEHLLPEPGLAYSVVTRLAGEGSLGR